MRVMASQSVMPMRVQELVHTNNNENIHAQYHCLTLRRIYRGVVHLPHKGLNSNRHDIMSWWWLDKWPITQYLLPFVLSHLMDMLTSESHYIRYVTDLCCDNILWHWLFLVTRWCVSQHHSIHLTFHQGSPVRGFPSYPISSCHQS